MKTISAMLLSAVALSPLAVHAADGNWYGLISAGQSTYDADKGDANDSLANAGLVITSSDLDDTDTGYKIQAGYKINQNLAIEGGFVDFGRLTYKAEGSNGSASIDLHVYGFNVDAVGVLPLGAGFSVFGKVGGVVAVAEVDEGVTGANGSATDDPSDTSFKATAGLGISFDLNETLSARLEYERFFDIKSDVGNGDVDLASIGLVARF